MSDRTERVRPVPTGASKVRIHALAESVAQKLNFNPGDAIDPIVTRLGGRIEYRSPGDGDGPPESMVVFAPKNFVVFIPTTTSPRRDRFTIAHELGHYFLHFPQSMVKWPGKHMVATRWVDDRDEEQQRAEWEANWFAAGFLMPGKIFRATWEEFGHDAERVSRFFDVSAAAARVRAANLQLA